MGNKIVKIPVSEIQGLRSDGSYLLRYRVKSNDGALFSEWSEPYKLQFPLNTLGQISSFYELYLNAARPVLENSQASPTDPHPTNPYDIVVVTSSMGVDQYIESSISPSGETHGSYTYKWTLPNTPTVQSFDVYLSWKDSSGSWLDWTYAGTTSGDSITFVKPQQTYQAVQAAVFLSSTPKLTNIFNNDGEITFVSISPEYSTYYAATGLIGTVSGSGPYTASVSTLSTTIPVGKKIEGRRVYADSAVAPVSPIGSFGSGVVTILERTSSTSVKISSTAVITAGNIVNFRI